MKKLKIVNIITVLAALVLEILPYGVRMKWADFYLERYTFHSYFDLTVWGYGDMGPFVCGVLTSVMLIMLCVSLFLNPKKQYNIVLIAVSISAAMLSVVPSFFGSYTVVGLVITTLLIVSSELSVVSYIKNK